MAVLPMLSPPLAMLARGGALLALIGVAAYGGLLVMLWFGQERLLFHPEPLAADHRLSLDADVHERWIDVPGARLHALHLKRPNARGVVFFLHGNAGNLESWFVSAGFYRALDLDLFMIDYRGYGKSTGRIGSEAQLIDDVRAAWRAVAPEYGGRSRIVYGRSLGTGLAARLAAEVQPDLTVLVSPYESMRALAREHYPWVPGAILRYPLRTDLALPAIRGPVLLVHGERDELIPADHARRLQARVPGATLLLVPGAGHGDLQDFDAYLQPLRQRYLEATAARPSTYFVPKILSPASPRPGMM